MRGLVIWLHGLGDSGDGWMSLRQQYSALQLDWKFPTAPVQPVSCNGGFRMTSWMDLQDIPVTHPRPDDVQGLKASCASIHAMIDEAIEGGTPAERVVVGGFSQGGAMALLSSYTCKHKLAGCVCFSGWPALSEPENELHQKLRSGANCKTPALVVHGTADGVVLPECGLATKTLLEEAGVDVTFREYPMAHATHPMQMGDLEQFLNDVLK